jgi:hypothetical protein
LSQSEIRRYYESCVRGLKKSGGKLRAPCPLHKGKRDSFVIDPATGGWYCHSECGRGGSIFEFESEITGADLTAAKNAVLRAVGRVQPEIVCTYDYTDETGTLLYQTVRYRPKDFRQRRPDGKGGWIWNLKGIRRVLYRLPAVMASKIVFVAEGEKDADALTALGVVATTSPLGAERWRDEYSACLRGKEVYIIPDADEPGRRHAEKILRSLNGEGRLINLPAHDASDWIGAGGTQEELIHLAEQARLVSPEYRTNGHAAQAEPPPADTEAPPERRERPRKKAEPLFTLGDVPNIWTFEAPPIRYLIPDLILEAAINMITGDSGHGKSMFALAITGAIIHGSIFLDRQCAQRKVVYLDRENPVAIVKQRLAELHIAENTNLIYWGGWCRQEPDGPASQVLLAYAALEKPVFIFDSLIAFHTGDEQDATETRRFMRLFRKLADLGATVILLHHIGKAETARFYRGSTDIKANIDCAWLLEKLGENPAAKLNELRLVPFKDRLIGSEPVAISFRDGSFLVNGERPPAPKEILEKLLRKNPYATSRSLRDLGMAVGLPKHVMASLLLQGVAEGWIQVESGARNSKHFSLAAPGLEI